LLPQNPHALHSSGRTSRSSEPLAKHNSATVPRASDTQRTQQVCARCVGCPDIAPRVSLRATRAHSTRHAGRVSHRSHRAPCQTQQRLRPTTHSGHENVPGASTARHSASRQPACYTHALHSSRRTSLSSLPQSPLPNTTAPPSNDAQRTRDRAGCVDFPDIAPRVSLRATRAHSTRHAGRVSHRSHRAPCQTQQRLRPTTHSGHENVPGASTARHSASRQPACYTHALHSSRRTSLSSLPQSPLPNTTAPPSNDAQRTRDRAGCVDFPDIAPRASPRATRTHSTRHAGRVSHRSHRAPCQTRQRLRPTTHSEHEIVPGASTSQTSRLASACALHARTPLVTPDESLIAPTEPLAKHNSASVQQHTAATRTCRVHRLPDIAPRASPRATRTHSTRHAGRVSHRSHRAPCQTQQRLRPTTHSGHENVPGASTARHSASRQPACYTHALHSSRRTSLSSLPQSPLPNTTAPPSNDAQRTRDRAGCVDFPDIAPRVSLRATRAHSTRHAGRVSHRSHRAPCQTQQRLRPTTHSGHENVPGASTARHSASRQPACYTHALHSSRRTSLSSLPQSPLPNTTAPPSNNAQRTRESCRVRRLPRHSASRQPACYTHALHSSRRTSLSSLPQSPLPNTTAPPSNDAQRTRDRAGCVDFPDIAPRVSLRATRAHSTRHAGRVSHRSHRAPCQTQQRLRPTTHSGHENVPGASTARHSASRQPACYTHALHSSRRTSLSSLPQSPLPNTTAPPSNDAQRTRDRAGCVDFPDIAPRVSLRATRAHSTRHAGRVSHRSHRAPCQTQQRLRPTTHSGHENVPGASTARHSASRQPACYTHALHSSRRTSLSSLPQSPLPNTTAPPSNDAQRTRDRAGCVDFPDIAPRVSLRATRAHSTRHAGRVSHRSHRAPCQTQQRLRPTTHSGHENVPGASTARHSASRQPACYTHALHSSRRTSLSSLPQSPLPNTTAPPSNDAQRTRDRAGCVDFPDIAPRVSLRATRAHSTRHAGRVSHRSHRAPCQTQQRLRPTTHSGHENVPGASTARHSASRQPACYTHALHSSRRTSLSSLPQSPLPNTTAPPSHEPATHSEHSKSAPGASAAQTSRLASACALHARTPLVTPDESLIAPTEPLAKHDSASVQRRTANTRSCRVRRLPRPRASRQPARYTRALHSSRRTSLSSLPQSPLPNTTAPPSHEPATHSEHSKSAPGASAAQTSRLASACALHARTPLVTPDESLIAPTEPLAKHDSASVQQHTAATRTCRVPRLPDIAPRASPRATRTHSTRHAGRVSHRSHRAPCQTRQRLRPTTHSGHENVPGASTARHSASRQPACYTHALHSSRRTSLSSLPQSPLPNTTAPPSNDAQRTRDRAGCVDFPDIAPRVSLRATRAHSTRHAGRVSHRSHRAPCQTRQRLRPTTHSGHENVPGASTARHSASRQPACYTHALHSSRRTSLSSLPQSPLPNTTAPPSNDAQRTRDRARVRRLPRHRASRQPARSTRALHSSRPDESLIAPTEPPCRPRPRLRPTTHSEHSKSAPGASAAQTSRLASACALHARTPLVTPDESLIAPTEPLPNTTAPPSNDAQRTRDRAGCVDFPDIAPRVSLRATRAHSTRHAGRVSHRSHRAPCQTRQRLRPTTHSEHEIVPGASTSQTSRLASACALHARTPLVTPDESLIAPTEPLAKHNSASVQQHTAATRTCRVHRLPDIAPRASPRATRTHSTRHAGRVSHRSHRAPCQTRQRLRPTTHSEHEIVPGASTSQT
jgi:hypothetical protein